jgi:hypothetical protein
MHVYENTFVHNQKIFYTKYFELEIFIQYL